MAGEGAQDLHLLLSSFAQVRKKRCDGDSAEDDDDNGEGGSPQLLAAVGASPLQPTASFSPLHLNFLFLSSTRQEG